MGCPQVATVASSMSLCLSVPSVLIPARGGEYGQDLELSTKPLHASGPQPLF